MTQAIGRARRYGQTKAVHVYHMLAKFTADVNVYQQRQDRVLVGRGDQDVLVLASDVLTSDIRYEGGSLEF